MSRLLRLPLALCATILLNGCINPFGEAVRAPVFEGDRMVARSGPAPSGSAYMVKPGDTLYSIAWRENMDYHALAVWNNLPSSYVIRPGQRLRLEPPIREGSRLGNGSSGATTPLAELQKGAGSSESHITASRDNSRQELIRKARILRSRSSSRKSGGNSRLRWRRPTRGRVVRSYSRGDLTRKGVHIGGHEGQIIKAAESGRVVYSGRGLVGYGNLVIVKHNKNYLSAYGNNRKILVKEGQRVSAGQKIAEMGRSDKGRALLHFEIRYRGKPINPASVVPL